MNNVWGKYRNSIFANFPDLEFQYDYANWEGKDVNLNASVYSSKHILRSREVEIWNEKSSIYNHVIYPRTGSNLPCFGMDLMMFFPKKVIIVFDFQHPTENYMYSVDGLPKCEKDIRFFKIGNHFSENLFVRSCTSDEIDDHLNDFKNYLSIFKSMVMKEQPTGKDYSQYKDLDTYMAKLDPVSGYLESHFGKEKAEKIVKEFLFPYGF